MPLRNTEQQDVTNYALRKQLGFKLSRTSRLMQQRLEAALATQGMTRLTWCVLSSIGLEQISTPSGVADNLGVTRPMLSKLIKSMTNDGLILSSLDHENGRNRKLSLTPKGQATLEVCRPLVADNNAHFGQKLSERQLADLHKMVDLLLENEERYLDRL